MISFGSVCENPSGRWAEQIQGVRGEGEEPKHPVGEIEKGGPLGPPLHFMGHSTHSGPDVKLGFPFEKVQRDT